MIQLFASCSLRVREVALGAFAHQGIPFEKLIEELQPERSLSHQPLFQVFFNMQNSNMLNFSGKRIELPGLAVEHLPSSDIGSKFDLTLYVVESADEMKLDLLYNADLFKPERMVEMLEQFKHLLEQIVEDPDKRINQFSLVTSRAREVLPDPSGSSCSLHRANQSTIFSRNKLVKLRNIPPSWIKPEAGATANLMLAAINSPTIFAPKASARRISLRFMHTAVPR